MTVNRREETVVEDTRTRRIRGLAATILIISVFIYTLVIVPLVEDNLYSTRQKALYNFICRILSFTNHTSCILV